MSILSIMKISNRAQPITQPVVNPTYDHACLHQTQGGVASTISAASASKIRYNIERNKEENSFFCCQQLLYCNKLSLFLHRDPSASFRSASHRDCPLFLYTKFYHQTKKYAIEQQLEFIKRNNGPLQRILIVPLEDLNHNRL